MLVLNVTQRLVFITHNFNIRDSHIRKMFFKLASCTKYKTTLNIFYVNCKYFITSFIHIENGYLNKV